MLKLFYLTVLLLFPATNQSVNGYINKNADNKQFFKSLCASQYNATCLKFDILSFIERFSERKEFQILPSISLVREVVPDNIESGKILADIVRSSPNDTEERLDNYIFAKVGNLFQSYAVKIRLVDQEAATEVRSVFTGRKKIGKKGGLEAIMAAGMMMKGTLMAIAIGGIALLAGKALMTGMMALVLAAVTGLKSLAGGGKQTTYEIVAKPVYSSSHTHSNSHEDVHAHSGSVHGHSGYGSYGRSLNLDLMNS